MQLKDTDIKRLHGIGAARAARYAALGISTVDDLLAHYPRGYEDRGSIKQITDGDGISKAAYLLTVGTAPKSVTLKGRMSLLKFRAYDDSGVCDITFFNQDYLKNVFLLGETYRFYGKIERKGGRYTMSSPAYEHWTEDGSLPDLIPVYPLTAGITQKQIAKDIRGAMALAAVAEDTEDLLPEDIRRRNALCLYSYAIKNIHSPESFVALASAKKRLIFQEFFDFALGLTMAGEKNRRAAAHPLLKGDIKPLADKLPYELTDAQKRVIEEIRSDLSKSTMMCRMVIGDVGSGKTVCAAAAMLFAVQSGYQAALMVPTEILARQHYMSLSELLEPLGIRTALLVGATTAAEKKRIYAGLASDGEGKIDIVIGTHAIISEGVEFSSLGLAVVDEQHRFGVDQRSVLSKKNPLAHTLVMSATPIPRSLALALYGDLDISTLDQLPPGRQRVDTFAVDESYRARLNGFIKKQVAEGGQVYVVCPAVEESAVSEEEEADVLMESIGIEGDLFGEANTPTAKPPLKSAVKFSEELAATFPELKVDFLHGKLSAKDKDRKMRAFAAGETDILVSTTVIEVGVNVPRASLMIVENAERFGLSQLHQLRGRVGRGERKSYCILVSEDIKREGSAKERLLTLKGCYDGYAIAEKDLAMRGPGDFLRSNTDSALRQSGGVRFRLAELCDDTGLMRVAFAEAKSLIERDPTLSSFPKLKKEVERMFSQEPASVN